MKNLKSIYFLVAVVIVIFISGCCKNSNHGLCVSDNYTPPPTMTNEEVSAWVSNYLKAGHTLDGIFLSKDEALYILGQMPEDVDGIFFQKGISPDFKEQIFAITSLKPGSSVSSVAYKINPRPCVCAPCCGLNVDTTGGKTPAQ